MEFRSSYRKTKQNFKPVEKAFSNTSRQNYCFENYFTTLPSPPGTYLRNFNTIFFSFLWDGKPEKISHKTVKSDYKYGGLKMVVIHRFMVSLKLSWLQKKTSKSPLEGFHIRNHGL